MKTNQKSLILNALKNGDVLTPIDALERFGCFRLGARINELKNEGYNIKSEMMRFNGKAFAGYTLEKGKRS